LSVDRIDFLRRELTVDRQLVTPKAGEPTFGLPKSARSYRTVPLADTVVKALAHHVAVHGVGRDDLVLHGTDGRPLRRQRFGELWRQTRARAGLIAAKFHTTRHTFASTLIAAGVSVPATAEYLGHSPGVLLATYAHLLPGDHDRARSAVEAAFADIGSRVTVVSGG
jgi:integrase